MSELANFYKFGQQRPEFRSASESHQLETFKRKHRLFDHVIFGLSLRRLLLLNIGNTIRFLRVVNYHQRSVGGSNPDQKDKAHSWMTHAPLFAPRFFLGLARLRTYEPSPFAFAHFSSIRMRAYAR